MTSRTRRIARTADCGACGLPTLSQHIDGLDITVNAAPIEPGTDHAHRDPNHLTWCAHPQATGPPRLMWIYGFHPNPCPHPHHAEHHCTTRTPTPQQADAQPALF